jgi:DNA invertase Pin-like site-specific DNA recombinase
MGARRLIGYVRVGPMEPRAERPRLDTQRQAIAAAAAERGWDLVGVEEDVRSGRTRRRPGLRRALAACRAGEADGVLVAHLDRLTYDVAHLAELVKEAVRDGFAIVALSPEVDLDSDRGAAVGAVLAEAAGWTPRSLVRRAEVLARRVQDEAPVPRRAGRPSSTPPEVADRIRQMRARGLTLQAICDTLNREGVPTPRGGALWRPTSLRAILRADG